MTTTQTGPVVVKDSDDHSWIRIPEGISGPMSCDTGLYFCATRKGSIRASLADIEANYGPVRLPELNLGDA